MQKALSKQDVLKEIVKLGHFTWYHNVMGFDEEGENNVRKIEELTGETIDPDNLIDILGGEQIDSDSIDYPHAYETGRLYEVYKFKVNGKDYYAVKDCSWSTDGWACTVDIYDNYDDVKKHLRGFYQHIIDEIEDVKPNIEDDDVYSELEDLEDYAEREIKKLQ